MGEFLPKFFSLFKTGYSLSSFRKDLISGITVGIIALPLAIAFGIASGVSPERGLITAIVAGFLISFLGGSSVQIGGPTGAFVVLVYEIVQKNGYEGLALATLVGAVMILLLAFFRLGSWIKYVPHPLVVGFTTGIAVIIFSSQVKDFFGLAMGNPPANFLLKWGAYFQAFPTIKGPACILGLGTLAIILVFRKFFPKIPWGIGAIFLATAAAYFFDLPVETIDSRFGELPRSLPYPSFPHFSISLNTLSDLFIDGMAIAFLGAIESLLSCVIADGMTGGKHRSNAELLGQGIANIGSIFFGGIPATGAIARTAANIKSGAVSPVSGMIHAATLFVILLFFSPLVSRIPIPALAAVLIMIAWNMSELPHFFHLLQAPKSDVLILLTSFFLTVFVDITAAILVGMILSSFLFMQRMSLMAKTVSITEFFKERGKGGDSVNDDPDAITKKEIPRGIEVYELEGPFFFGSTDMLSEISQNASTKVFILRMRKVPFIDASGMHALKEFHRKCVRENTILILSGVQGRTEKELIQAGLDKIIGKERIFSHIDPALEKARLFL